MNEMQPFLPVFSDWVIHDKKASHSGAIKMREKYPKPYDLASKLYVATAWCAKELEDVIFNKSNPNELLILGEVAKWEYICCAEYRAIPCSDA